MKSALALIALFPLSALATDPKPPPKPPGQEQEQLQHQSQYMNQQQVTELSQANAQSVTFRDRLQAPASFTSAIAPTAPCYYSVGAALSIPGGSIGGGKAILDPECEFREELRLGYAMGLMVETQQLWCQRYGEGIEDCGYRTPAPAPVPVPDAKPTVVVLQSDGCDARQDERLKRVLDRCVPK